MSKESQEFSPKIIVQSKNIITNNSNLQPAKELERISKEINLLKKLSSLLTSGLEIKILNQKIVDSIVHDLGYCGGVLCFVRGNEIISDTISSSRSMQKGIQLLGRPLKGIRANINKEENLFCKTIKYQKIYIGSDVRKFISPPVNPLLALTMQKVAGVNTLISLPIMINKKPISLLLFALKEKQITYAELDLMKSFSNQVAIALENARLFEQQQHNLNELKQKTVDLVTIQEVSKKINRTLDMSTILQYIVDIIPGTILPSENVSCVDINLYHEEKKCLIHSFITQDEHNKEALTLSIRDKPLLGREVPINEEKCNLQAVFRQKKIIFSANMQEFIYPYQSLKECIYINKFRKVRSIISIPIVKDTDALGVLTIFFRTPKEEIPYRVYDLLLNIVNQVALSLDNAKLFTRLQKINKELVLINQQLKQLDAAKDEFISIASHQLRTPLSAIKGYLATLIDRDFGSVNKHQLLRLERAMVNIERMMALINDLLDLSRIQTGQLKINLHTTDYLDLVNKVFQEFELFFEEKKVSIVKLFPKTLPRINLDQDKIRQVIINLLDNAIKYSESDKMVTLAIKKTRSTIVTSIQDQGIGISKKHQSWIFDKFYRVENGKRLFASGTGIGLFVSKKIIELHQGTIEVKSTPGKGSTFSFSLPIQ